VLYLAGLWYESRSVTHGTRTGGLGRVQDGWRRHKYDDGNRHEIPDKLRQPAPMKTATGRAAFSVPEHAPKQEYKNGRADRNAYPK
jgi:hypothetical protein